MITIIHGDDLVSSRNYFLDNKKKAKNPILLEGEALTFSTLSSIIDNVSIFEEDKIKNMFIENFFTKNKAVSKEFKDICGYLEKRQETLNIFFFEQTLQNKIKLTVFKKALIKTFKLPQMLFQFLDGLKPHNSNNVVLFHQALQTSDANLIFVMIVRQFRLLLALSDQNQALSIDELSKLAPWQKDKLQRQSAKFSVDNLKQIYQNLEKLDKANVTGQLFMSFESAIDFFLLEI